MVLYRTLLTVIIAGLCGPVCAGDQFVNASGFANAGFDVVADFDLPQSGLGARQPLAVPGRADLTARYNGATFAFAMAQNRDRFLADPGRFAPAYDGHCAFGVATGGKVPGNPHLWRIVEGILYLNIDEAVTSTWEKDVPGYIASAQAKWPKLEAAAASTMPIPRFDVASAPIAD